MPRYIDCCSYDDYDRVVRFLLEKRVKIIERDKMKMLVVAELPKSMEDEMSDKIKFDEVVTVGESPL